MTALLEENTLLKTDYTKLLSEYRLLLEKFEALSADVTWFKRQLFGSKSERFVASEDGQMMLSLNAGKAPQPAPAPAQVVESYERQPSEKKGHGRCPIPAHIKRVDTVVEPVEDVTGLVKIGTDITEELEFVPPVFVVNRTIRPKYAKADGKDTVVVAELPPRLIEKGRPGAGLLTQVAISRFVDHMPYYRQSSQYARNGICLSRSTLSNWMGEACEKLKPVFDLHRKMVLRTYYLQADETPILVLENDEEAPRGHKDRKKARRGYFWVYLDPVRRLVFFDYRDGRSRAGPAEVLKDFKGTLQTDDYGVYESLAHIRNQGKVTPEITLAACLAHVRRKFDNALENDPVRAEAAINLIKPLYAIEAEAREKNLSAEERYRFRHDRNAPVLMAAFKDWLIKQAADPALLPQSPIGKAVSHALNRWDKLQVYLTDGQIEIDNNLVENAIRPVALGRKNWMFCGSSAGAERAAMIFSFIGTCKLRGNEPFKALRNLIEKFPLTPENRYHELLFMNP